MKTAKEIINEHLVKEQERIIKSGEVGIIAGVMTLEEYLRLNPFVLNAMEEYHQQFNVTDEQINIEFLEHGYVSDYIKGKIFGAKWLRDKIFNKSKEE